jgi:hypothetical protein
LTARSAFDVRVMREERALDVRSYGPSLVAPLTSSRELRAAASSSFRIADAPAGSAIHPSRAACDDACSTQQQRAHAPESEQRQRHQQRAPERDGASRAALTAHVVERGRPIQRQTFLVATLGDARLVRRALRRCFRSWFGGVAAFGAHGLYGAL